LISIEGNRIFVFGEVKKPGSYAFTGSGMKLMDAVASAGGPTVFAKPVYTKIVRGEISNPEVIGVNLDRLLVEGDQTQNMMLFDGDLVYVPRSAHGDINVFLKRIRPILSVIAAPARIYDDYDDIND